MTEATRPEPERPAKPEEPEPSSPPPRAPVRPAHEPPRPRNEAQPSPEVPPRPFASALRAAGLRAALLGALYEAVWLSFCCLGSAIFLDPPPREFWFTGLLASITLGLVAAPLAFVESFFATRPRSIANEVVAGLVVWGLAVLGLGLAALQVVYTFVMFEKGSFEEGARTVAAVFSEVLSAPWIMAVLGFPSAPFLPTTVGRLTKQPLKRIVRSSVLGGGAIAGASALVLWIGAGGGTPHEGDWRPYVFMVLLAGLELGACAAFPLVLHGADRLEARIAAWLERRDALP